MESCAQENKTCFVQICIQNKYQPFRMSGSAEHCSTDNLSEPALGTLGCRKAQELSSNPSAGGAVDAMQAQS